MKSVALVAVLLIGASTAGCGRAEDGLTTAKALSVIDGLEQTGAVLGNSCAPAQLTVFLKPDSYRLAGLFQKDLVELRPYIRARRLSVIIRTTTAGMGEIPNDDAARILAAAAQAAGLQGRLWDFLGAVAANYIGEASGSELSLIRSSVPRFDSRRARTDEQSRRVKSAIDRATSLTPRGDVVRGIFVLTTVAQGSRMLKNTQAGDLGQSVIRAISGKDAPDAA